MLACQLVYKFDNEKVKPNLVTGTRWICHKLKALENYLDDSGLYTIFW